MPLIEALTHEGYQIHIACSDGEYVPLMREKGHTVHVVPIPRYFDFVAGIKACWKLYRLMKREHFDIVHVHTPMAAAFGRIAAKAAGVPVVIYTAHGFYFHERMAGWLRKLIISLERGLAHFTNFLFTQSQEDAFSAVRERICSADQVICIGNGVEIQKFSNGKLNNKTLFHGIKHDEKVIGFVGRIVREKGVIELIRAMALVIQTIPETKLVIIGDTLESDRDQTIRREIQQILEQENLGSHILFRGFIENIPDVLLSFDIFVLPSYREGMPRSIIEAMASGKPVVATNIRGCREEVIHEITGLLVPVGDYQALAKAITRILNNPDLACQMGEAGRLRAIEFFDEKFVLDRQIKVYAHLVDEYLRGKI